jgi:hypothetical protein
MFVMNRLKTAVRTDVLENSRLEDDGFLTDNNRAVVFLIKLRCLDTIQGSYKRKISSSFILTVIIGTNNNESTV